MLYYIFYFIFSSFCSVFTSFYPLLLHFCMKCFKLVDLFVFPWWIFFCYLAWNFAEKIFLGSHPGINFGAIYYPSLPFTISISNLIFLYIVYYQFVTILKRSFYHWDGFKNYPRKNSKNRFCYRWRVWHCWRTHHTRHHPTTQYHPISYFHSHSHSPPTLISIGVIVFASTTISRSHDQAPRDTIGSPCCFRFAIQKPCYKTYEKTWQKSRKKVS